MVHQYLGLYQQEVWNLRTRNTNDCICILGCVHRPREARTSLWIDFSLALGKRMVCRNGRTPTVSQGCKHKQIGASEQCPPDCLQQQGSCHRNLDILEDQHVSGLSDRVRYVAVTFNQMVYCAVHAMSI